MSLSRRIRAEVAGAWRSVGYDLGRRPSAPAPGAGPDVTSTGMNTFPGSLVDLPAGPPETGARPPRRFVAVTAFCALAAAGAGGSYAAATTLFAEEPVAAVQAAPGPDQATGGLVTPRRDTAGRRSTPGPRVTAAMGSVPVAAGQPRTTSGATGRAAGNAVGPAAGRTAVTAPPVAVKPAPTSPAGRRTVAAPPRPTRPGSPECHCPAPPVPTPTSLPDTPSGTPSPVTSSAAPAPSPSEPPAGATSPSPAAAPSSATGDPRPGGHHGRTAG